MLEVVRAVERVSGRRVPMRIGPRRPGDPAVLVAGAARIREEAGWAPRHGRIEHIVETAYRWRLEHPLGYGDRGAERRPAPTALDVARRMAAERGQIAVRPAAPAERRLT